MKRSGFTLIELLVVIIIVGILAAFGIPQYIKSVETSKANDAASLVAMVGTTNRMYALDHTVGGVPQYVKGSLSTACGAEAACPAARGVNDPCSLVTCRYLAAQDFDTKPYAVYGDNGAGTCTALGFPASASGFYVACAVRRSASSCAAAASSAGSCASLSPYRGWGYAVNTTGVIQEMGGAPPPVQ